MAPEQEQGKPEPRSDVYSLGKTFEFLTNSKDKSTRVSTKFRQLISHTTRLSANERPMATWIVDAIDQLLALRLARRQVVGLSMVVMSMMLFYLTMFLPGAGFLPEQLVPNQARANNLQQQLNTSQNEARNLTAKNGAFQQQLDTSQSEVKNLTAKNESLQREIEALRGKPNGSNAALPIGPNGIGYGEIKEVLFYEDWSFTASTEAEYIATCTPSDTNSNDECGVQVIDPTRNAVGDIPTQRFKGVPGVTYTIRVAGSWGFRGKYSLEVKKP